MQQKRNAELHRPMPSGQAATYQLEHMFVFYGILDLATWAVPSESLQGVRRVPMAKFTACCSQLLCSFYRSRYLFLPFSNGQGVKLAI